MSAKPLVRIATLLCALAWAGCNSGGTVTMTAAAQPAASQPSATQERSSSGATASQDPIVYFDRIAVREGIPEALLGLGFLREGANTQSAFGLRFKAAGAFFDRPSLSAGAGAIVYLKPDGIGHESLRRLDPSDLSDRELARLPGGLRAAAVSDDLRSLAWVDSRGQASAIFNGGPLLSLELQLPRQASLRFSSASDELQVQLAASAVFFQGGAAASTAITGYPLAREARGGRLALGLRSASGLVIGIRDPAGGDAGTIPVDGRSIRELRWSDAGRLAFVLERGDGTLALMTAQADTGQLDQVAQLGVAASAPAERIICPVWHGDTLYYGDALGASYAIYQATRTEGGWVAQVFARAPVSAQGFVCPKISQPRQGDRP